MVKPETDEDIDPYSPEAIEIMVEYARGIRNLENAARDLYKISGLLPEYGKMLLRGVKTSGRRSNASATIIRGHSNEPERMAKGKIGKKNQVRHR